MPIASTTTTRTRVNFYGFANSQANCTRTMECGEAAEPTKQLLNENELIKLQIGYSTDISIYAREQANVVANSLLVICINNSVSVSSLESIARGRRQCRIFLDIPVDAFAAGNFNFKINQAITIAGVLDLNQLNRIFNSFPALTRYFASLYLQLWTQDFLQDLKIGYKIFGTYDFPYEFAIIRPRQMTIKEAIKAIKRVSKFKNNEAIAEVQEQQSQYADKVYDSYKGLPFKVQIDSGVLLYEKLDGNNYKYSCRIPSLDNAFKHKQSTISDKKSLEQFKVDMFKQLREMMERTYGDTENLIVGIFNVMFATYKLIKTGARMPYLDKHVKQHSVHYIDSDYKICFFIALAYKIRSEIDEKVNNNSVITFAKQLFAYYYRIKGKYQLFEYIYNNAAKKDQSHNKYLQDYQGFNISTEMTQFTDTFNLVVNIYTYHEELEGKTGQYRLFNSYGQLNNESMTLDLLLISDGTEQHIMFVSNVEKLTGVLICPYCHDYVTILSNTNKSAYEYFKTHVDKCKSLTHEPSILLHDVPMPICPAVLNHSTVQYLMAYGIMDQFKAQRGFITYELETLSDQVMKNIIDQTTLLSQLSKLSIASAEVFPNQDKSYELVKRCYTLFDELSESYQEQLENYGLPSYSSFG
ncbi:MAG: hypothetical protein EZS28_007591 [Streblomastix strix]|uniref:Uncharacterized protein n=1 Tax=Streblomastix strix TaxID=222440 RepID=A0A5J4WPJ8_9EUKA|nr:MAG: hypothetical protein EZS28_007591 [Streblomastix strix]